MSTYLQTTFKERERVKGLGARWDPERRQWFVPEGRDLTPFAAWLPQAAVARSALTSPAEPTTDLAITAKGIGLAELLAGVAQAVAQAYRNGQWVRLEVVRLDARRGHVYLEAAERNASGELLAQARAVIWAETAQRIVPIFEKATGVILGAGIKLLVRARPTLHPQYGLSLQLDAIDPEYTLGDLEAKKREIRQRLQREGLLERNRRLPPPWDYRAVLVIAPQGAAGLGDFLAEADRLQRWGLCHFVVVHSRFQGEGAAADVRRTLMDAMEHWADLAPEHDAPDAVVIIRGGGAVNDLAWLNDYDLARSLCELTVPVLTGIGHERDSTVLDEVAHISHDTPSKVITAIEQHIAKRAREAHASYEFILQLAAQAALRNRRSIDHCQLEIRAGARLALSEARQRAARQLDRTS